MDCCFVSVGLSGSELPFNEVVLQELPFQRFAVIV